MPSVVADDASEVVATGTVRVRDLDTGIEWDEKVTVYAGDIEPRDETVEDVARMVARAQAEPADVATLETDLS